MVIVAEHEISRNIDALRAGHGLDYYPGETNIRLADVVVINKVVEAEAKAQKAGKKQG